MIAIGFAIYLLIYWRRLLLNGQMPFDGDTFRLVYPSWSVGKELLKQNAWLWDPFRNMGTPFLASPPNQALYPLRFLSLFLNILDYQRVFVVFHTLLAASFTFLLLQKKMSRLSALTGALGMAFNGAVLARATITIDFATYAWIPGILYFFEMGNPIFLGVFMTAQWLAGLPTNCILTFAILCFFVVTGNDKRRSARILIQGSLIAAGLSAVQFLPFLEMMRESVRPFFLSPEAAMQFSVHPLELVRQLLVPAPILTGLNPVTSSDPAVTGFYIGPFLLGLAVYGWIKGKTQTRMLGALVLISFLLCLGHYTPIYRLIPFITVFRFPSIWLVVSTVSLVLLAAEGMNKIRNAKIGGPLLFLVAVDLLMYAWPTHSAWGDYQFISDAPRILQVGGELTPGSRVFHTNRITDEVQNWEIRSKEQWLQFLKFGVPSMGVSCGVHEAESRHNLPGKRHEAFVQRLNNAPLGSPLFDYAGISRIVTLDEKKEPIAAQNLNFFPRCFTVEGKKVELQEEKPGSFRINSEGPGTLVVSESYDPGWKVWVDGKKETVGVFEDCFISVVLPGGMHGVHFVYRPLTFQIGAGISLFTLLLIILYRARVLPQAKGSLVQIKSTR